MYFYRLKELRKAAGLTQKEVAEVLDCSQQAYSDYELGKKDIPTSMLTCLADLYQTTTMYLLGLTDYPYIPPEFEP